MHYDGLSLTGYPDTFTFFVKVDQRKQPFKLEPISVSEGNQLVVIRRKFSKSERKLMGSILGK